MLPFRSTTACVRPRPVSPSIGLGPVALLGLLLFVSGCDAKGGNPSAGAAAAPEVVRSMAGDTTVVRTVSGSVWGGDARLVPEVEIGVLDGDEAYMFGSIVSMATWPDGRIAVMDRQTLSVRVFGPDGILVGEWGREGQGPGEFQQPDGGMTVLSDGRLVVRDPGNARFQLYTSEGEPAGQWNVIRGGFNTSSPFELQGDTILTSQILNLDDAASLADWERGYVRVGPAGEILDSVRVPTTGFEGGFVTASRDGSSSRNTVPWAPQEVVAWHPEGYFVRGIADDYAFTLLREGDPLRIERSWDPIPVAAGEKAEARATTTRNLRRTDPNWRWNGPEIPDTKSPFDAIHVGRSGRIWVLRDGPGYEQDDPDHDPTDPESFEDRWREDRLLDVFQPDGTFLGTLELPRDFSSYPAPIFDGDLIWATTRDEFGVQRVVRYRIEHG